MRIMFGNSVPALNVCLTNPVVKVYRMSKIESIKEGFNVPSGLSLAGGIIILLGGIASWIWHTAFFSQMGWMMGGTWFTPMIVGTSVIGIVSGALVMLGAVMMAFRPNESHQWGVIVLVFSLLSFFGMGGFLVGAILGIVGGALALAKR
jgi:hypothetical protein